MVIFVLAMAAVLAALWSRTCFLNSTRTEGTVRLRWRYHGAFWGAAGCALAGLGLLLRSPGFALAGFVGALALFGWGLAMKLRAGRD